METKTRKAKLNEIRKLRKEIIALGGTLEFTENDLNKVDNELSVLMFEQSGLANTPTAILTIKQKARLKFLNETIKKVQFKLRLDRADLKFKKNSKLVGNIHEGFSVKKIGKSKVTLFN